MSAGNCAIKNGTILYENSYFSHIYLIVFSIWYQKIDLCITRHRLVPKISTEFIVFLNISFYRHITHVPYGKCLSYQIWDSASCRRRQRLRYRQQQKVWKFSADVAWNCPICCSSSSMAVRRLAPAMQLLANQNRLSIDCKIWWTRTIWCWMATFLTVLQCYI